MANRLADETSPYLRQHAGNPVDWYPWGEEAKVRAKAEDKPILLSIGYSACHWCHVMAHESFEDPDVAALMNALFVNVKVDREERPDLDQVYQLAHALLARRSGGWPLTMVLTPDGEPFFGGTYFPKEGRHGLPGFREILPKLAAAYREQGPAIAEQTARLKEALGRLAPRPTEGALPLSASAAALASLKRSFDAVNGGFGAAPKFPHPTELTLCLRAYVRSHDAEALAMVERTLAAMAAGGIHDQLGGGFCRYSVDAAWTIPHFEKMLYDNGPLLGLYADLSRIEPAGQGAHVARGVVGWATREMRAPDGTFYSSLDADSEGEEGKFYVWTRDEVQAVLDRDELAVAVPHFGFAGPPNFEHAAWHLRIVTPLDDVADQLGISLPDAQARLMGAKAALFAARAQRVRPGLDDKILTSWNALMVAGLARAGRALDEPGWIDLAVAAVDALRRMSWKDGRLFATRQAGRARLNAYLDDYAFLLAALVELMQSRFRLDDYRWARELADVLLDAFEDRSHGGFWFTSHDHETLIERQKPGPDNATPSGNGIAAQALIALGHLASEMRYLEAAERAVRAFGGSMRDAPAGFATLLAAMEDLEHPPTTVLLAGDDPACAAWQGALEHTYRPFVRIFNVGRATLPAELNRGAAPGTGARAWVCRGTECLPAVSSLTELRELLA
ncbi:MAG: thioredoxin domain-containing protein [Casimicrobiaceae bacterium]